MVIWRQLPLTCIQWMSCHVLDGTTKHFGRLQCLRRGRQTHTDVNTHMHTQTNTNTHTQTVTHTHIRYLVCSTPTHPSPTFTLYIEDFFWAEFIVNQWQHWELWEKNTLCGRPPCGDIMVVTSSSSSHQHRQHLRPLCGDISLLTSSLISPSPSTSSSQAVVWWHLSADIMVVIAGIIIGLLMSGDPFFTLSFSWSTILNEDLNYRK